MSLAKLGGVYTVPPNFIPLPSRSQDGQMITSMLKLKRTECKPTNQSDPDLDQEDSNTVEKIKRMTVTDLGNASEVLYTARFLSYQVAWDYFHYLDKNIPWTRPTVRVFGRSCVQPRDTCYVASEGLPELVYSGYQPHAYSWDEFPPLKEILDLVHKWFPGSEFNSLILNRYKGGNDHVGWHADHEKLYGPTPEIASVSFGCERDFFLKKKPTKVVHAKENGDKPPKKRAKKDEGSSQHSFVLKHGSLLVMRGYTQRDWFHSVPKRAKAVGVRINLTFRRVFSL